jgi:hypothetical protein
MQLGDSILASLDVPTGKSRIVTKGTAEFAEILAALRDVAAEKRAKYIVLDNDPTEDPVMRRIRAEIFDTAYDPANAHAFKVMESVAGDSMAEVSELKARPGEKDKSVTVDDVVRVSELLLNEQTWTSLGSMMVADALMGNVDRVSATKMNIGNILISKADGKLVAIDTATTLDPVAGAPTDRKHLTQMLETIGDPAKLHGVARKLVEAIVWDIQRAPVQDPQATKMLAGLTGFMDYFTRVLTEGVNDALKRAYETFLLTGAPRRQVESQASTRYGQTPNQNVSYERLTSNTAYAFAYASATKSGVGEANARRIAEELASNAVDLYRTVPSSQ